MMKDKHREWSTLTYMAAFLLGALLFWSFGKDWLNLESAVVFLAGLVGVAVAVLIFSAWQLHQESHSKEN